jgi:hypothetical protein
MCAGTECLLLEMYTLPVLGSGADADNGMYGASDNIHLYLKVGLTLQLPTTCFVRHTSSVTRSS